MDTENPFSGAFNSERFVREALVVETALIAEKILCWLLLAIGSMPNDSMAKVCQKDERFPLPLVKRVQEPEAGNDEGGKTEDDAVHEQCHNDDHNDDMSEEDGSDGSDEDPEEDVDGDDHDDANGERGSSDGDEGDGDGDDGYSEDEYDEEDGEEYEEDEEEEETDNDDTTSSEYDDDSDDEPGYGSLLRHAREVYTLTSFFIFEHEYKKSKTLNVDVSKEDFDRRGLVFEYKLEKVGHKFQEHTVTAVPLDDIIDCSCKYFDSVGILCCHALKVLGCLRIEKIPDQYILMQRTKNGRGGIVEEPCNITEKHKGQGSSSPEFIHSSCVTTEESEDDVDMHTGHVDAPLLRHARDIYMSNIFAMFREEYKKSEYLSVRYIRETYEDRRLVFDCEVRKPRHSRSHKVHAEPNDGRVNCSCKGFENTGILCCHALSVLDCLFIESIPAQYILEKFLKNPGFGMVENIHGEKYSELGRFIRFITLHSMLDEVAKEAAKSEETKNLFLEHMDKLRMRLGDTSKEADLNETEDKGMKKAMGLTYDKRLTNCNDEESEAKRGQSTATVGTSSLYFSSPSSSPCHTFQDGGTQDDVIAGRNEVNGPSAMDCKAKTDHTPTSREGTRRRLKERIRDLQQARGKAK